MPQSILNHLEVERIINLALDEDGIKNDLTTRASAVGADPHKIARATIIAKKPAIAAGFPIVEKILKCAEFTNSIKASSVVAEASAIAENAPWIVLEGNAFDLLRVERTLLNFLMRMSGIATATRQIVQLLEGTECKVLHTRKTVPGHRRTDIYAALIGGAHPHRRSLDDAILVKENHLRTSPSFQTLIDGIREYRSQASFVEVEVSDFIELKHALMAKPDRIMLDNFEIKDVERAVNLFSSSVQLEASGMITAANARQYAETGVDYISMGSITHSAAATDLSMLFDFK